MEQLDTPVAEVMTEGVRTVDPGASAREVSTVLASEGIGSVVVADGRGILTKTDVVAGLSEAVDPDATPASVLMSSPLVTVDPDATLQAAVDRMGEEGIKRLVVTDGEEPVGILTTTDVVEALSPDLDQIVGMFVD